MSQVDGCRGDVMTDVLPWIQDCVCQFYRIPDSSRLQLSLSDTALLYRSHDIYISHMILYASHMMFHIGHVISIQEAIGSDGTI